MTVVTASNTGKTEVIRILSSEEVKSGFGMARFEQFEIWQLNGEKWELLGAFADMELANTMARSRDKKSRLIRAVYENDKKVEQDVIADLGATRDVA